MSLGEFEKAIKLFNQVSISAENTSSQRFAISSWCCLAFLNSLLGFNDEAEDLIVKAHSQIATLKGSWYKIYGSIHLGSTYRNLGNLQKATELFWEANFFSENSNRFHGKALALLGLAEVYREKEQFEEALSFCLKATEILRDIEAECNLAEAHHQIGLNYQLMKDSKRSNENFQEAIRLFSKIGAPKQVEQVRRSMEGGA
jgi:tetratricopeptide (TPR) repeat protein